MAFTLKLKKTAQPEAHVEANRRAVTHLFGEYERARSERDDAEERLTRFSETVHLLLGNLPQADREELSKRFDEMRSGKLSRGNEVFDNVISLISRRKPGRTWTVPEVHAELTQQGVEAEPKAVSNAVAYLAKTGRLLRVARGQYVAVDFGSGVIDLDGPDHGMQRTTEHDW